LTIASSNCFTNATYCSRSRLFIVCSVGFYLGRRVTTCFGTIKSPSTSLAIIITTSVTDKTNSVHPPRAALLV
jgi:hypothetical protein